VVEAALPECGKLWSSRYLSIKDFLQSSMKRFRLPKKLTERSDISVCDGDNNIDIDCLHILVDEMGQASENAKVS
jgi:hypothetical protein